MASRRQFLAGSVVSSALMTSFAARAGTLAGHPADKRIAAFLFDERFEFGQAMAQHFDPDTTRSFAIRGDVSGIWYDHIVPGLAQGAHAIGGVTNAGGLFVLARLGHDAGLTLVLHGVHCFTSGDTTGQHALEAPDPVKQQHKAALAGGTPWMTALQTALMSAVSMPSEGRQPVPGADPFEMEARTTLHSWLLVPRG